MAQETNKITEVDKLTIWVLTDNYFDTLRPDSKISKRYRVTPGKSIHAEHGLAYFIETVVDGKTSTCMFDYGLDPIGVMNNKKLTLYDEGIDTFFKNHLAIIKGIAASPMVQQSDLSRNLSYPKNPSNPFFPCQIQYF